MLRTKTLLLLAGLLTALFLLLYFTSNTIVSQGFRNLEEREARRNIQRVLNAIDDSRVGLQAIGLDWAHWDDTYQFVADQNQGYLDANLNDETFERFNLNVALMFNTDGELVYETTRRIEDSAIASTIASSLEDEVRTHPSLAPFLRAEGIDSPLIDGTSGIVMLPEGPMMLTAIPVTDSLLEADINGLMVWGRYLDEAEIAQFSALTQLDVSIYPMSLDTLPRDTQEIALRVRQEAVIVQPIDDEIVGGYTLIGDLGGNGVGLLQVNSPRQIYQQSLETLNVYAGTLIAAGLGFILLLGLVMERLVLNPISSLSRQVRGLGEGMNHDKRLTVQTQDELGHLAATINSTLDALEQSRKDLKKLNSDLENRIIARTVEVNRQREFLRTMLDIMDEGVIYCADNLMTYVNDKMVALAGRTREELIDQPIHTLFKIPPLAAVASAQPEQGRIVHKGERRLRMKDGHKIDVGFTVTANVEFDGQRGDLYIFRDISEEKAIEMNKDRFLVNASHELRTPLTNIVTRLYLLRRQPDKVEDHLQVIEDTAKQMRGLVEDLLDVSHFKRGTVPLNREPQPLQDLILEVTDQQHAEAERKHLTLTTTLPDEKMIAFIDRRRFHQVLTNLINNAIKYTPDGGKIDVILRQPDNPRLIEIQIKDNGIGIDSETLPQLFQPFFRATHAIPGTGLGLSIVKEIVERHGGQVLVTSKLGEGSTFTIQLMHAESPTPEGSGGAISVVE